MSRRHVIDLPVRVAAQNTASCAPTADIEPPDLAAFLSQRESNSDVRSFRATLTTPMLILCLLGELFAIAKKMLLRTLGACALGHSFGIICIEVEIHRPARARGQAKFLHPVTLGSVCLHIFFDIFGTRPNPPLTRCVDAHNARIRLTPIIRTAVRILNGKSDPASNSQVARNHKNDAQVFNRALRISEHATHTPQSRDDQANNCPLPMGEINNESAKKRWRQARCLSYD